MEASAFLLLFVPLLVQHVEAMGCPGCPEEVDDLNDDDQRIVDFAMVQLEMVSDNAHARKVLHVRDFKRQVVAGTKYIFTLDLVDTKCPKTDQLTSCDSDDIPTESCTVSVWERVWLNSTIFNGDDVKCTRHPVIQNENVCHVLKQCSSCLDSPTCKWCKELGYDGARCNDNFEASVCSPAAVLDPQNNISILSDSPTNWRNFMRPEHVTFALRPNKPGSIDITFVAISMGVTMLSNATDDIRVTFETSCDGYENKKRNTCHGLSNGAVVIFTANVEVLRCPKNAEDWKQSFEIFTESYASSERMTVDVDMLCGCQCELSGINEEECPTPQDHCHAKTSCVPCIEVPECAWRKSELSSPNGDVVPHCFQNDGVSSSEDILNHQGDILATQDTPLNLTGDVFFQPQQVSASLRLGQPQVIDFSWGKKQPKYDMFGIEIGDNAPDFLEVTYSTSCAGKFAEHKRTTCPRLWMGYSKAENLHPVEFQATIKLLKCPVNAGDWHQTFQISPINKYSQKWYSWVEGLDETLNIDLTLLCQECDCQKPTDPEYEENSPKCSGQGTYKCGQCNCLPGRGGPACEVDERLEEGSYVPSPTCLRPLRKPDGGVWSCVNEDGTEGCQLVCPIGMVAQSGSFIHCNGSAWSKDPADFACVMAMTLMVGGGERSDSKYHGDIVKAVGKGCSKSLANVPNMQMYGHTVDVLDKKAIVCGGTKSRVYTYYRKCHFLSTRGTSASRHYFQHHSDLIEKRRKHASVVIKDRLYLIGGEYSPNTTEYMSLTKNIKAEKWMVGCGESKVTATEENLEEILDFMEKKLGSFAILTVANGQVFGRGLGGKIEPTAGEGYFHLLEADSGGKKQGNGHYVLTANSAGRSSRKTKKMMGLYQETCKTFGIQNAHSGAVYMKLESKDKDPYFLYVNGRNEWSIGTELNPTTFLMYFNSRHKPLLKYSPSKWNYWKYMYNNKWYSDKEMTVLPYHKDYGTWHKGFDLGINIVDACAVKTGIETFLVIGVGNDHREMVEFNVTDGSERKIVAKLNTGRVSHECAYMENSNERMIVIAGGAFEAKDGITLNSTEIFKLDNETIEEAGDLNVAREDFVMYVQDGLLYSSTGIDDSSNMVKDSEVFDVETKSWELFGYVTGRQDATAAGVPYGMVTGMVEGC